MNPCLLPVALAASLLAQNGGVVVAYDQGNVPRLDGPGTVSYLSGGIGTDAREGLEKAGRAFPLKVVLATTPGGRYLAMMELVVRNADGKTVLKLEGVGPWVYLDLPQGAYVLEGRRRDGQTANAGPVTVAPGRQARVALLFPVKDEPQ